MANHRKACRNYPAGRHHKLAVFLRLVRFIINTFNQICPNLSRKKATLGRKKREKWKISGILINSKARYKG
jgi:hypothetical protein